MNSDIIQLRADARELDLANRVIAPDPRPVVPTCRIVGCDSILTISDWQHVCQQCRLAPRVRIIGEVGA